MNEKLLTVPYQLDYNASCLPVMPKYYRASSLVAPSQSKSCSDSIAIWSIHDRRNGFPKGASKLPNQPAEDCKSEETDT
jgi:hypothetical protein